LPVPVSPVEDHLRVRREALNQAEDVLHRGAAAEHPAELQLARHLALERDHLRAALELEAGLRQNLAQPLEIEGLGQVLARAELDGFDRAVDRGVRGHQNHLAPRMSGADLPQEIEPVHVGHAKVDHRQIGGPAREHAHRFHAAAAGRHVKPCFCSEAFDDFEHWRLVVDDQQQRTRRGGLFNRCRHLADLGPRAL
jgi:hypothetical protein